MREQEKSEVARGAAGPRKCQRLFSPKQELTPKCNFTAARALDTGLSKADRGDRLGPDEVVAAIISISRNTTIGESYINKLRRHSVSRGKSA